jgi:hypothetical protein
VDEDAWAEDEDGEEDDTIPCPYLARRDSDADQRIVLGDNRR